MDLRIGLEVESDRLERARGSAAGKACPGEVEHEVESPRCGGARGDQDPASMPVQRRTNITESRQQGWHHPITTDQRLETEVAKDGLLRRVDEFRTTSGSFLSHRRRGLCGISGHEVLLHGTLITEGLLKPATALELRSATIQILRR